MMLVFTLGTAIAFSSCSKDNDDEANDEADVSNYVTGIVGTWADYYNGEMSQCWIFNSDNTLYLREGEYEEKLTYRWDTPTSFYVYNYGWHCNVVTLTKNLLVIFIVEEGKGPTLQRVK